MGEPELEQSGSGETGKSTRNSRILEGFWNFAMLKEQLTFFLTSLYPLSTSATYQHTHTRLDQYTPDQRATTHDNLSFTFVFIKVYSLTQLDLEH